MRYHDSYCSCLLKGTDKCLILGFACGRVGYMPSAKYLYSFRLFLFIVKLEILWTTNETTNTPPTL